jgi:hypothetical protein
MRYKMIKKLLNENCDFAFTVVKDENVIVRVHMAGTNVKKINSIKCVDGWAHFDDVIKLFRFVEVEI